MDAIAVLVTRGTETTLEILVHETQSGALDVPRGFSLPEEHPTEAACRLAATLSGFDVFFTFRKLSATEQPQGWRYVYQTSPEVDLPATFTHADPDGKMQRFSWVHETDVSALPADLAAALARLAPTPE